MSEFMDSWALFGSMYITALVGGALLGLIGVVVVARDQFFLAAAVSQSSTLGVALSLYLGWTQPQLLATALSVIAAIWINRRYRRRESTSQDATGWVFLAGAALAILVVAKQPYGMRTVQSLTSSSMIGVSGLEAGLYSVFLVFVVSFVLMHRWRLVLWIADPTMAAGVGMRLGVWDLGISIAIGLTAGLMLRSTGLLFTFGCLTLPALVAKQLASDVRGMLVVAPIAGFLGALIGLYVSHAYDLPPGQVIVVVLAILVGVASLIGRARQFTLASA